MLIGQTNEVVYSTEKAEWEREYEERCRQEEQENDYFEDVDWEWT